MGVTRTMGGNDRKETKREETKRKEETTLAVTATVSDRDGMGNERRGPQCAGCDRH